MNAELILFIVGMVIAIIVPFALTLILSKRYMKKGELEENKVS